MNIEKDKLLHLLAGVFIALIVAVMFTGWLGVWAAIIAGVAKEAYDKQSGKGVADVVDALYTAVGGIVAGLAYIVIVS